MSIPPDVKCISNGKTLKKYEFGCKVIVAATSKESLLVGIKAYHDNLYDGHTLKEPICCF